MSHITLPLRLQILPCRWCSGSIEATACSLISLGPRMLLIIENFALANRVQRTKFTEMAQGWLPKLVTQPRRALHVNCLGKGRHWTLLPKRLLIWSKRPLRHLRQAFLFREFYVGFAKDFFLPFTFLCCTLLIQNSPRKKETHWSHLQALVVSWC